MLSQILWTSPPPGILKLIFEGSYLQFLCKGGFGVVIRDCNGNVVMSWFGPVDYEDANEAEVFAPHWMS